MAYIVAIGAYLVLLMIFGLIVAHKKVKTSDDMVTGGHRIPFIVLVGTLLATWCGCYSPPPVGEEDKAGGCARRSWGNDPVP